MVLFGRMFNGTGEESTDPSERTKPLLRTRVTTRVNDLPI